MKSYKDYMDRIQVDEEQHARFLKAINEAEAADNPFLKQAAIPTAEPEPQNKTDKKKKSIFHLSAGFRKTAGIAAAAVLALVLIFGTGGRGQRSKAEDTGAVSTDSESRHTEQLVENEGSIKPPASMYVTPNKTEVSAETRQQAANAEKMPHDTDIRKGESDVPMEPEPDQTSAMDAVSFCLFLIQKEGAQQILLSDAEEEMLADWMKQGKLIKSNIPVSDIAEIAVPASAQIGGKKQIVTVKENDSAAGRTSAQLLVGNGGDSFLIRISDMDEQTLSAFRKMLEDHGLSLAE